MTCKSGNNSVIVLSTPVNEVASNASSQPPRAIVVLLGWWCSQVRHVQKYSKIYEERGCVTVAGVAPPRAIMSSDLDALDAFACKIASHVADIIRAAEDVPNENRDRTKNPMNQNKIPVLFHVFSNGGAYPLHRLELLIQLARKGQIDNKIYSDDLLLVGSHLQGEIFDSAPAFPHARSALLAMESAISNPVIRELVQIAFLFHVFLDTLWRTLTYLLGYGWVDPRQEFWRHLTASRVCLNQAFVYSTSDRITDVSYLEDLIEKRKQHPRSRVSVTKFDDSDHVQHLRTHETEYRNMIDRFIDDVLREEDGAPPLDSKKLN